MDPAVIASGAPRPRRGTVDHMGWPGLTTRLENALGRIRLSFQPVVLWPSGQVLGWETLVRTDAPGFESAESLVFAAEFLGRVPRVGRAIRREVTRELSADPRSMEVFLDVQRLDLLDDELYAPDRDLARVARQVFLEFTEEIRAETVPDLVSRLAELRALGYRLSLDDVALTRDSEARLERLAPDVVKIDAGLVRGIARHRANASHVGRLLRVLRDLGIEAVARGVENTEDLAVLVSLGCAAFQGGWFGGPQQDLSDEPRRPSAPALL
jgi:EAL domain-containing protein (putative c-di-GMP-specific phosphodiesterase class I)